MNFWRVHLRSLAVKTLAIGDMHPGRKPSWPPLDLHARRHLGVPDLQSCAMAQEISMPVPGLLDDGPRSVAAGCCRPVRRRRDELDDFEGRLEKRDGRPEIGLTGEATTIHRDVQPPGLPMRRCDA